MNIEEIRAEDLEARIARLEEGLWFQERKLEDLDKLVRDLQTQQNIILRQLEQTGKLILHIRDVLDTQSHADRGPEPIPPHYQQI